MRTAVRALDSAVNICENDLFDEVSLVKRYVTDEKIKCWLSANVETDKKWTELFLHFKHNNIPYQNILKIVEFALSLPGTNTQQQNVFFLVSIKYGQLKKRS